MASAPAAAETTVAIMVVGGKLPANAPTSERPRRRGAVSSVSVGRVGALEARARAAAALTARAAAAGGATQAAASRHTSLPHGSMA